MAAISFLVASEMGILAYVGKSRSWSDANKGDEEAMVTPREAGNMLTMNSSEALEVLLDDLCILIDRVLRKIKSKHVQSCKETLQILSYIYNRSNGSIS